MGLTDVFGKDDRIELKVNELIDYFRDEADVMAENKVLLNGLKAGLPTSHILVMIGKHDSESEVGYEE